MKALIHLDAHTGGTPQGWRHTAAAAPGGSKTGPRIPEASLVHDTWNVLSGAKRT